MQLLKEIYTSSMVAPHRKLLDVTTFKVHNNTSTIRDHSTVVAMCPMFRDESNILSFAAILLQYCGGKNHAITAELKNMYAIF
jgi:hypothetical protein